MFRVKVFKKHYRYAYAALALTFVGFCTFKMSTRNLLSELLSSGLIQPGDLLFFTFKAFEFRTHLMSGGILTRCEWKQSRSKPFVPCFTDRQGFTSLTDWCDSCIQELANEYVTRFSSWKRVKHCKTQHPMAMLREQLRSDQVMKQASTTRTVAQLEKLLSIETKKVFFLQEQLRASKRQKLDTTTMTNEDNPFRLHF